MNTGQLNSKRQLRGEDDMTYNDFLDKIDTKLVGYFGGYCEVRSLEFLIKWGAATEHPIWGKLCKKLYDFFCKYYAGFVVPNDGSLSRGVEIMPYESILELIKRAKVGRVWPCSCKSFRETKDDTVPRATCMFISEVTALDDTVTKYSNSEWLPADEIIKKLEECEEAGLVHQIMCVSNPQGRKMYVLCNCDTQACVPMYLKLRYDIPFVRSSGFVCTVDDNTSCTHCNSCVERCPFDAVKIENGDVVTEDEKCLGCGLCVTKCEANIRKMVRDPREKMHDYTLEQMKQNPDKVMVVNEKGKYPTLRN